MIQKMKRRLAALAITGLVIGGGFAVATEVAEPAVVVTAQHFGVPLKEDAAQAATFYKYSYCPTADAAFRNYGWRSQTTVNTSRGFRMSVYDLYWGSTVKSGSYGSGTVTIKSGVEDARFTLTPASGSSVYSWTTSCYWVRATW